MPYGYLEGNQQDQAAINRMGSTFSDAVIGMQRQRIQQQQFQQEMALRAQQMAQQRDAAMRELDLRKIDTESLTKSRDAQTNKILTDTQQTRDQGQAGGMLGDVMKAEYETDPQKNPDVAQFLRGIQAQQTARIAATDPRNIALQAAQIAQGRDPQTERMMATGTPAMGVVAPGSSVVDFSSGRQLFHNEPRVALRDPQQLKDDELQALIGAYGNMSKDFVGADDPVRKNVQNAILSRMGINNGGGAGGGDKVIVRSKEGKLGRIPASQLKQAMAEGYTQEQQ